MFLLNLRRIIRSGFVSFWRNGFVSLSSILVMTVTLFVMGSLIFLGATLDATLEQIKNKVDVNVYFVTSAPEEDILALKAQLEALPEVASVEYLSREGVLDRFKERHEGDQLTLQALDELGENPLGATLNIRAKETSQYEGIAHFLQNESALESGGESIVDSVNFFQNRAAIEKLDTIIKSSQTFSLVVTIVLVIASIIITFNTIRLAIYTSKDEISVMRLVGASNFYIRGPFVFEGMMYGFVAAVITLVLFYPLTFWLGPVTEGFFGDINIFRYYVDNFGEIFLLIIGTGIVLGAVSSFLAVRKYLRL
ncbi:MAG TPA: permease-like cell division protein FtsX [Candidatus Paceibacterota bacterium]